MELDLEHMSINYKLVGLFISDIRRRSFEVAILKLNVAGGRNGNVRKSVLESN